MTPGFMFNWEKYSVKDIKEYLEFLGFVVRRSDRPNEYTGSWFVDELHLEIAEPYFGGRQWFNGFVRWDNSPSFYDITHKDQTVRDYWQKYLRDAKGIKNSDLQSVDEYNKHQILYQKLQRKFRLHRSEYYPKLAKDIAWMDQQADAVFHPSLWQKFLRIMRRHVFWHIAARFLDDIRILLWAFFHPHILWRDRDWFFNARKLRWMARLRRLSIPPLQFGEKVLEGVSGENPS